MILSNYRLPIRIRLFEQKLLELYGQNKLSGTIHTCIGQEFCASTLYSHLSERDAAFSNHRCHGHFLAYGGPQDSLLAEFMNKEGALCQGRGGSQHLHHGRFFSNGIQGGLTAIAVGFAWALQRMNEDAIAVCHLGDGTLGEGLLYEALNLASLLQVPVLFSLEFNGWAQSSDVRKTTAGDILARAHAFGIEASRISDRDVNKLSDQMGKAILYVRTGKPFLQVIDTRRLMPHSKGDDSRSPELIEQLWAEDPLEAAFNHHPELHIINTEEEKQLETMIAQVSSRLDLTSDIPNLAPPTDISTVQNTRFHSETSSRDFGRISEELNKAFDEIMTEDPRVILIGEDINDPYGGAFKVSKGLSTKHPNQVFSSPISEGGIVGLGNGLALAGMKPVVEIMFGDFITLAADQIINHAAKFNYMYGDKTTCPLVVRTPSGGYRGYGPTHSQSLERMFCGIPGLRVVALSHRHNPGELLKEVIQNTTSPILFVENKDLYSQKPAILPPFDLRIQETTCQNGVLPPLVYKATGKEPPQLTVVTYGGIAQKTEEALCSAIYNEEISFDYIILTELWPLNIEEVAESVSRTKHLLVVEEGVSTFGIGSAVITATSEKVSVSFRSRCVGCEPHVIPNAKKQEEHTLPSARKILDAIMVLLEERY